MTYRIGWALSNAARISKNDQNLAKKSSKNPIFATSISLQLVMKQPPGLSGAMPIGVAEMVNRPIGDSGSMLNFARAG